MQGAYIPPIEPFYTIKQEIIPFSATRRMAPFIRF